MPKVEEIKVINVDDQSYSVDQLPEDTQRTVELYNEWREDEAQLRSDLMKVQAAMREVSKDLIQQIRNHRDGVDEANQENGTAENEKPDNG